MAFCTPKVRTPFKGKNMLFENTRKRVTNGELAYFRKNIFTQIFAQSIKCERLADGNIGGFKSLPYSNSVLCYYYYYYLQYHYKLLPLASIGGFQKVHAFFKKRNYTRRYAESTVGRSLPECSQSK